MFSLSFDTDNAAFKSEDRRGEANTEAMDEIAALEECARILFEIANKLKYGTGEGRIYDVNGNRIGSFRLEDR